ncbi:GLPGLI family protein [Polaribacter sp. Hel1_33_78]|uniref:GLPGLI family protein n=1 Tax=Polaribacter sp. Hel1_33_78 TaxID=1336804 RepID=UPI00087C167D|nr:GLPGLI family protein [Polaribacter sp. Hel1_33_78]SDU20649.1 GLPGLI family protein [Polaribacter sp. Hel1_33_78]
MKLLFTFLLAMVTVTTFAQKDFQGKATYMSKTTMDMNRFGEKMSEQQKKQMMARFKNFLEKNYTLSFNKTESSFKEDVKLDAPGTAGRRWGNNNGQGSIYKNLKDREMIEDVEQFSKRFLVVEKMDQPKWEMGMETKKIGQYTCYKATMVKVDNKVDWGKMFSRRGNSKKKDSTETVDKKEDVKMLAVTAWYTPQIPVSSGPGTYFGLPGLILEINEGRTTMLCTEIVMNPAETIEIKKPTKGKEVNREEYNKIVKKKSEEIREQFKSRGRGGRRF